MAMFFAVAASLTTLIYGGALFLGHFGARLGAQPFHHLLIGLVAAILSVSLHCLVFALFTGAGKDTRLLVEDLGLDPLFVKRMKAFKFEVFPPALYAILAILVVTSLGGGHSSHGAPWLGWLHLGCAWAVFYYNTKVFWQEYRAIGENGLLLARVNEAAAAKAPGAETPAYREVAVLAEAAEHFDWGTHVYALGRFLTFLGYNTWLPYVYLKFIVGYFRMPWWPYVVLSLGFFLAGGFLRLRYGDFRPGSNSRAALLQG